jgi:2-polyprenyl-3-methyl-5-hydroxy-6-metoxy-1,4-benzoquinol methylase
MNQERSGSQDFHDREARDRQLFNDTAARYCRKDLLPASKRARKLRLVETLRLVPLPAGARVMEVGCGSGFAASYLRDHFGHYTGVDYSENLIEYARLYNAGPDVDFITTNIKTFSSDEPFDMIFLIGVLHHLDEMEQVLRQLVLFLKPGGWLVANEPQPANPVIRLARFVRTKLDRGYSSEQLQLSASQLRAAYAHAGLIDIRTKPQGLFSTPFAEIPMQPQWLAEPLSTVACLSDVVADRVLGPLLHWLTWNMVVAGRRPPDNGDGGTSRTADAWGNS